MNTIDTARLRGAGTGLEKTLAFVCQSSGAATKRSSSGGENVSPIYQSVTLSTLLLKCSWKYFIKIYQGPLYKLSQPSFHGNCVVGGEIVSKQNSPHSRVETGWMGSGSRYYLANIFLISYLLLTFHLNSLIYLSAPMNIFSSLSRWKMTEWCIFLLIYVCIVIQVLVIWQARPIHTAVSTKCHSGDKLILMLYVRCHHYCFLMTSPPSHQLPGQTLVFRLTFFRERKVKNKSFSLTLQNFFLPAFKSTKYLSLFCCKATSF